MRLKWQRIDNPALKVRLQLYFRNSKPDYATMFKLAQDIYRQHISGRDVESALQAFLNVADTVDKTKSGTIGRDAPADSCNILLQVIAALFATEHPFSSEADKLMLEDLREQSLDAMGGWFHPKLTLIQSYAYYRELAEDFVSRCALSADKNAATETLLRDQLPKIADETNEFMQGIVQLRKYGVKPCFFQDGMLHRPEDAWVFMDHWAAMQPELETLRCFLPKDAPPLAILSLSQKDSIERIGTDFFTHTSGSIGMTHAVRMTFPSKVIMSFDAAGEMDVSLGFNAMPLRDIFRRRGTEHIYEMLRYAQAIRLFDLVVPMTAAPHELADQIQEVKGIMGRLKAMLPKKHLLHPDLILPRLRSLDNIDQMMSDLEREVEQAEETTRARAIRELRKHEVVCHVRRLPPGKRATPDAKERAQTYGITLLDGETFVKTHHRGGVEPQAGAHRAKHQVR